MSTDAPRAGRVSHACMACATRKVRCSGGHPCVGCSHLGINCTFRSWGSRSTPGSRRKRGDVILSLRTPKAKVQPSPPALAVRPSGLHMGNNLSFPVNREFFLDLLEGYQELVYSACPVVTVGEIRDSISRIDTEADHRAFCYAYSAVTLALSPANHRHKNPEVIKVLASRSILPRPVLTHHAQITLKRVTFSLFLRITFGVLQDLEMDFFYLREAVTMLQMLGIDKPSAKAPSRGHLSAWQRLHWVVFIQERLSSITNERMAALDIPINPPIFDDGLPSHIELGFTLISALFRLVDEEFMRNWCEKENSKSLTLEWVVDKQEMLENQQKLVEEAWPSLTELQRANTFITCQWLGILVWQMAACKYMLHSDSARNYLLLLFPVQRSVYIRGIIGATHRIPQGSGTLEKLFEIATSATDVVNLLANFHNQQDVLQWVDNCRHLIQYLQQSRYLNNTQRLLLQQKLETLDAHFMTSHGPFWQNV